MKKILLVDDSATILMSMKQLLSKHNLDIDTADDGTTAMTKINGGYRPDLIITDVNMPKMNGLELVRQVKQTTGFRFTPILILTTEYDEAKRSEAKQLGATGWLVKPVKAEQLLEVLKKVLPGAIS